MRIRSTFIILIVFAVLLAACGANPTQTEVAELSNVYTAAASTLTAQATPIVPTAPRMIAASPTRFTSPSLIPATVTSQSVVSYLSASTANGCNDTAFISDVTIPDGTSLAPGEAFVKTWEFQNTGTCDWNENYLLMFVSGTEVEGETTGIDQDVATGAEGDLSVSLIAPDGEGSYTGYWRLADEDGNVFGQSVYVMIVVTEDASTLTPTPTATTETVTETLEFTSTPLATETLTPTSIPATTPTETPEPTPTVTESAG